MGHARCDESREKGMGSGRLRFELWMILYGDKPRVVWQFDRLDQRVVWALPCEPHAVGGKLLPVDVVELVAVPMTFGNLGRSIALGGDAIGIQHRWLGAKPHRATFLGDRFLLIQQADHGMLGIFVKFCRMCPTKAADVAGKFDDRTLHSETDSKKRHAALSGVADRLDLAFDPSFPESSRHQDAVVAGEEPLGPLGFDLFAANPADPDLGLVGNAGVVE